jgi:uncharacterized protein YjgD (DUF1641 family)
MTLSQLNAKLDFLTEQVIYLTRRQRAWDELREDMAPIVNDGYQVLVDELSQLDREFSLEDVFELARKLLRNTRGLIRLVDQLRSMQDLLEDLSPLSKDVFSATVEKLDEFEHGGHFALLRETASIFERIAEAFSPDDVRALGNNIVGMLTTLRNLTQPDVLSLLNTSLKAAREDEIPVPKGLFGMVKALRDPAVRRGVAVMLNILRQIVPERENGKGNALMLPAPDNTE